MSLHATLTWRYALALCLVAGVLLGSYAVILRQHATGASDGAVINRAGMQRMLSQRVALLAVELSGETGPARAARLAASLGIAAGQMAENHAELSARGLPGSEGRGALTDPDALYFGRGGIDEKVSELLSTTDALLRHHRDGGAGTAGGDDLSRRIAALALGGLLDELDAVVLRYETAFELGGRDMLRLETMLLLIALTVLLCEAGLIYRPMVRRVVGAIDAYARANTELLRSNERLSQFTYLLAHDLRAPISSSRGIVSLLNDSLERGDVADARELGGLLDGALPKLDALMDDLAEVVRIGALDIEPETVDLRALVDEVIDSLSRMPGAQRMRIAVDGTIGMPVLVKRVHLRSAIGNLVSNAIKYADPDEPAPHLQLSISRDDRRIRIEVRDNGLGIPERFRDELFDMFKRFHPRVAAGSGLGLHLVQLNARAIGGRIDYEPLPDGSRFSLAFDDGGATRD